MAKSKSLLAGLKSSALLKSSAFMLSGTLIAQVVTVAASPVITRLYSPEQFGVQGVLLSILSIAAPIVALRYPMAIVLAKTDAERQALVRLSLRLALISSGLSLLGVLLFRNQIAAALGIHGYEVLLFLLPLAFFLTGLQEITNFLATSLRKFKALSASAIVSALLTNAGRIVAGLINPMAANLAFATSLNPGIHSLTTYWGALRKSNLPESTSEPLKLVASKFKDFPKFRAPNDLLNAVSQGLPVVLLTALFSPAIGGLYTLGRTVLNLPMVIMSSSLGQVLLENLSSRHKNGLPLAKHATKITLVLLGISATVVGTSAIFFPWLFEVVFGSEWREAGVYAQWMALWTIFAMSNVAAVQCATVLGRQKFHLALTASLLIIRLSAILAAYLITADPLTTVIWFSLAGVGGNTLIICTLLRITWTFDKNSPDHQPAGKTPLPGR